MAAEARSDGKALSSTFEMPLDAEQMARCDVALLEVGRLLRW
jgi:hypothetical protein